MGNQESVSSNDTYVVRKKKISTTKSNQHKNSKPIKKNNNIQEYQQNYNTSYQQNHQQNYNTQQPYENHFLNDPMYMQQSSKPKIVEYTDYNNGREKLVEKQYQNSALMERSVLSDIYIKNNVNRMMDYPSNSNNQLSVPKVNIDNIEFTPYNFNDEVDKFKKSILDGE
jgi:hypothetical protein